MRLPSTWELRIDAARALRRHGWWLVLVAGAFCTTTAVLAPHAPSRPAVDLLGLTAALAVVGGIHLHRPARPAAWWCFAAGLTLSWAGRLFAGHALHLTGSPVRLPTLGDALGVGASPLLAAGLLALVHGRSRRTDLPSLVDALIIALGLGLVSIILLIAPDVAGPVGRLWPRLVAITTAAGDIGLLAVGVRFAIDGGSRRGPFLLIVAALALRLGTDFAHGLIGAGPAGGPVLDAGWIAAALLWGAAALHPAMGELSDVGVARAPRLTPSRLGLLAGAILIAPILEFLNRPRHDPELVFLVGASVALYGLAAGRMYGLVRQRERAVSRERSLAALSGRLVGATSTSEITAAALRAAEAMPGQARSALVCRVEGEHLVVAGLRDDGSLREWVVPNHVGVFLRGWPDGEDKVLPEWLARHLQLPPSAGVAISMRIPGREAQGGRLIVADHRAPGPETRQSVHLLGNQLSLALERAELTEQSHRRASEARFASLVQNASDLICVIDEAAGVIYASPSVESLLGRAPQAIIGRPFTELLHAEERGPLLHRLADNAWGDGVPEQIPGVLAGRDGSARHFELLVTDLRDAPEVGGILLNGRDVSERRAFEQQLTHQAFHDPVTHLANRALFNERVTHASARARREPLGLAVIFVDLDDFKTVNDSLGHAAGDAILLETAKRLSASVRTVDTPARFGGDEFAILLEGIDGAQDAVESAERILDALAVPLAVAHTTLTIRASLGIAVAAPGQPMLPDELIRDADAAMYVAKAEGKSGYRMFEPAMHRRVLTRLELRGDLQRALDAHEFELHYQPLVRLSDHVVTGVEALLRWNHPTRGVTAPDDFVPFAEETGLIVPIGRWALREGCRQAAAWRNGPLGASAPSIGINLSVKQIFSKDIVRDVRQALEDARLDPAALVLEITESVMMTDTEQAARRLHELHALGVRLAMDDFGTGYSSLSYLSRFPLDILKMDRSLLATDAAPHASGLATAVLGLGETFDLEVVAEGIERDDQSAALRALGCETGQGFFFARPMPAAELAEFLDTGAVTALSAAG